jgi:hypothetical protein
MYMQKIVVNLLRICASSWSLAKDENYMLTLSEDVGIFGRGELIALLFSNTLCGNSHFTVFW